MPRATLVTPLVNPHNERTTFNYDAANREVGQLSANETRTSTVYDAAGQALQVQQLDAGGNLIETWAYTYDAAGRRTHLREVGGVGGWDGLSVSEWSSLSVDSMRSLVQRLRRRQRGGDRAAGELADNLEESLRRECQFDENLSSEPPSGTSYPRSSQGLVGVDFERWLRAMFGGDPPFSRSGRQFDGSFPGGRWHEEQSGRFWIDNCQPGPQFDRLKSTTKQQQAIASSNRAQFELHSNSPIPQYVKDWLRSRGIPFFEHLC